MERKAHHFRAVLLGALVMLLGMSDGWAEDSSSTGKSIGLRGTPDGVAACIGCHGAHGAGNAAAGFPRLAGTSAAYLATQLDAFTSSQRQSPIMQPIAKTMSREARAAVAGYFSELPAPAGITPADSESIVPSETGAWIATHGRWNQPARLRAVSRLRWNRGRHDFSSACRAAGVLSRCSVA